MFRKAASIAAMEQGRPAGSAHTNPRFASVAAGRTGARYAALPPASLAALSVGQSDLYPYYFKVTQQSRQSFVNNDELENPSNLLAGRFDLAFVIVYLYPLLILALSYNLLSQEREQGTLAILMAQPLSLARFVTGKVLLRAAVVLALTLGFSLLGFWLSGALSDASLSRLALWLGVQKAQLQPADYDGFPAFQFREESLGAVAPRTLIGLLGLLAPALLIGWYGVRTLRHYSLAG